MSATTHVYRLSSTFDDDRPTIDFELEANVRQDWGIINDVVDGNLRPEGPMPISITVTSPEALNWDFFSLPGTLGVISERALHLLQPLAGPHFEFFELRLNGVPYWVINGTVPLNCLDISRSVTIPYPHDSTQIMIICKYCFRKEAIYDPLLFWIPEHRATILGTDSVAAIVAANLRGILVEDAEKL